MAVIQEFECDRCKMRIVKSTRHQIALMLGGTGKTENYDLCGYCVNQFKVLMSGEPVRGLAMDMGK